MKKFVSMAMVAAMTTSMVPATAFAGIGEVEATAKIVDAWTMTEDFDGNVVDDKDSVPELQIKITDTNYKNSKLDSEDYYAEITVALDNAELDSSFTTENIGVRLGSEAKEELNADITGSSTAQTAAQNKIDDAIEALYGQTIEELTGKEDPTEAEIEAAAALLTGEDSGLVGAMNDAKKALDDALAEEGTLPEGFDADKLPEVKAAKDAWEDAQDATTDALAELTTAKANAAAANAELADAKADQKTIKDAIAGDTYDVGTFKYINPATGAEATESTTTVVATLKADTEVGGTTKDAYDDAVEAAVLAEEDVAEKQADFDEAKAAWEAKGKPATGTEKDNYDAANSALTSAKGTLTTKQGTVMTKKAALDLAVAKYNAAKAIQDKNVEDAQDAVDTAQGKVDAAGVTAAQEAHDAAVKAEADAKDAYDEAKAEAEKNAALENGSEEVEKLEADYKAAKKAVEDEVAKLEAATKALEDAKTAAGEAGEAMASTFVVEAVEGFGKARAAVSGADEFTFGIKGKLHKGDVIYVDLTTVMDKTSVGKAATLDVESDDLNLDVADLVYVAVEDYGITATVKKIAKVAEEEKEELEKDLKIESVVGDFAKGQEIELKLSNGFEFDKLDGVAGVYSATIDDDKAVLTVLADGLDEIVIPADAMTIEAVKAKSGDVATITVKAKETKGIKGAFAATTKVEVMKVVDYTVEMSVDEDEDIPVIYSGVNVANTGITDDSDHLSLEVTIEESFPGAWSMRKGFNLELPDGVYVTDVEVVETEGLLKNNAPQSKSDVKDAFFNAYQDGDHKGFEFEKRVFDDVNNDLEEDCATMTFQLEMVADPTFAGDVNLKLTGDLVDEQEVTIAKFMPIAVVEAEQNDMKIDYRYTEIPTAVTVTETAAGLWEEGSQFWMAIERGDMMSFEDDATFEVTGGLEIDDFEKDMPFKSEDESIPAIGFEVDEESDEAATVTISNMQLFMQRNIPAGAYDLIAANTASAMYLDQQLFAPDCDTTGTCTCDDKNNDCFISDVEDFSDVVKEAFVNVVTAGREQDDASFTTKVVVPVGESYIVAGENQITLDVPAYVSAAGYTMLPVRAVATALGINNNNVIWNGETKTVTILYGQRIITMVAGQKTVNVNGSVIPASAAVEIVDGRTFLPMRDLATALGVTDITWDAATKTATLNGGVVAE